MRISDWSADVCSSDLVEDDYHCMRVTLHHDGMIATRIEPELLRAPWTPCPGASAQLVETFTGVALADFPARGDKPINCTHLNDLALLAEVHAADTDRKRVVEGTRVATRVDIGGRSLLNEQTKTKN